VTQTTTALTYAAVVGVLGIAAVTTAHVINRHTPGAGNLNDEWWPGGLAWIGHGLLLAAALTAGIAVLFAGTTR
jgi:hypothetical protein